ncbi:MAG: Ig-like domain-containing protein, partial [Thermoanaerobaculia bacterium]
ADQAAATAPARLTDGDVALDIPGGGIGAGAEIAITSVGAQSLAGLLPLGWSPLGSAQIDGDSAVTGTLSFAIDPVAVAAAGRPLSLVRYDSDRDEWRVIVPSVALSGESAEAPVSAPGAYALVYPDRGFAPAVASGSALPAAPDPCATTPCALASISFELDPPSVLPTGTSVATLLVDGAAPFPSGTAVQAWIDEELRLADGSVLLDPPFAADLILYRTLEGDRATAVFNVAPSERAAAVILDVGFEHVRVRPYPGRLARGTLVGPEGGRIPSDENVTVEIPAAATPDPIRASAASLGDDEIASFGTIAGFRVLGGVALELEHVDGASGDADGDGVPDATLPVVLNAAARVTFRVDTAALPSPGAEVVVAEVLGDTAYGRVIRLAARTAVVPFEGEGAVLFTTAGIDRSVLPLDGVVREGRYLFLAAEAPIAFATGAVRRGASDPYVEGALVSAPPLGVRDLTRLGGLFALTVPAAPAPPFSVVPRHISTGEGTPRVASSSPEAAAVVSLGDVLLEAQPPEITSTVPANGATDVLLTTTVRVQFDRALDPPSIATDSIVVSGAGGAAALDGPSAILWSLPPGASLLPATVYTATVSPQVRSASGAPLGQAFSFSFATPAAIANDEVRPELISITIPDANGVSTIRGAAGALPSGWQAVAVRRARDFLTRYQATANADGSFSFTAGTADPISIADRIDLHAVNLAGSIAAIVPLTPFETADGNGFIAHDREAVSFESSDGISVSIPAEAFSEPVLVTLEPEAKAAIDDVPRVDEELQWTASVELNLDCTIAGAANGPCRAGQRMDLEIPVPTNTDTTGRIFLLALRADSVRGPRLMVVDTLRVESGRFTTAPDEAAGASFRAANATAAVMTGSEIKDALQGVNQSGVYAVVDVKVPAGSSLGWAVMDSPGGTYDLFWDSFESLFASSLYLTESRGRIAIPVLTGKPFKIVGVDAGTGLDAFEKVYDPLPVGDPGAAVALPSPLADLQGPYPVFGAPFRIETLDLEIEQVDVASLPNFLVRLEGGLVEVTDSAAALPADVAVTLINPANAAIDATRADGLQLPGKLGDRILLLVREKDVPAASELTLVFSEPVSLGGATTAATIDAFLKTRLTLERRAAKAPAGTAFVDVTESATFSTDSGDRRVRIALPASFQLDARYRLKISKDLADAAGMKILQWKAPADPDPKGGLSSDLILEFITRAPGGPLTAFDIRQDAMTQLGAVRDLALHANMMFVSAMDGGLLAYDVSNAGAMGASTLPL